MISLLQFVFEEGGPLVSFDAVVPPLTLFHNLVLRPFHRPVFDCVQFAKKKDESLRDLVM